MDTVISNEDRIAIAEVDYIIHHMNERYLAMIPQKVRDYITILKKRNIKIYVDPHQPLENQGLKEFTLYFLMILNLKYWCDDARRKDILLMLENNQKRYEEKINNIFENAESIQGENKEINNRPLNQPRQIIVAENSKEENNNDNVQENNGNILKELEKETNEIVKINNENIIVKLINKIKSFFVKK